MAFITNDTRGRQVQSPKRFVSATIPGRTIPFQKKRYSWKVLKDTYAIHTITEIQTMKHQPLSAVSPAAVSRVVLTLVCALLVVGAFAQPEEKNRVRTAEIDGVVWKYRAPGDQAVIATGDRNTPVIPIGTAGRIVVPGEIAGLRVRKIGNFAFAGCARLEEVVLPHTENRFLEIGPGLFADCRALRRVVFPERFTLAGGGPVGSDKDLFHGCEALEEIVFTGDVPDKDVLCRLGVSLNGRLRFTEKYAPQWEDYVQKNNITGWKHCDLGPTGEALVRTRPKDIPVDLSLAAYRPSGPVLASLKDLSDGFLTFLKNIDADCAKAKQAHLAQRRDALLKAKAKMQAAGDLEAVMAFEEALKSDTPIETSVKALQDIYEQSAAAEAQILMQADERRLKGTAIMAERLSALKVKETKGGNLDFAKEAKAYEDQIKSLSDSLRKRMEACGAVVQAAEDKADAAEHPPVTDKAPAAAIAGRISIPGSTAITVTVDADDDKGTPITGGAFEKGDLLVVQYVGGEVSFHRAGKNSFNPDRKAHNNGGRVKIKILGPDKTEKVIPAGTEEAPFVFEVPSAGRYRLTGFLGEHAQGKASYQVIRVTKFNVQKFKDSPLAKQCQF